MEKLNQHPMGKIQQMLSMPADRTAASNTIQRNR